MYYYGTDYDETSLMHYGVKGMKWGVRKQKKAAQKVAKAQKKLDKVKAKSEKKATLEKEKQVQKKYDTKYKRKLNTLKADWANTKATDKYKNASLKEKSEMRRDQYTNKKLNYDFERAEKTSIGQKRYINKNRVKQVAATIAPAAALGASVAIPTFGSPNLYAPIVAAKSAISGAAAGQVAGIGKTIYDPKYLNRNKQMKAAQQAKTEGKTLAGFNSVKDGVVNPIYSTKKKKKG